MKKFNPILSICIPTYNNSDILYKKASEILLSKNKNIQLVISDNCSTDDTIMKLKKIKDYRLKFMSLDMNHGSIYNIANAYNMADGKFAMICMDKDIIQMKNIDRIVSFFEDSKVNFGYFGLDLKQDKENIYCNNTEECMKKFAYKGLHPTGTFFQKDIIKNKFNDLHLSSEIVVGAFITDFMLAEASLEGNGCIVNIPLCNTVRPPFEGKKHSYTYSSEKHNVFFEPFSRFESLKKYLSHLDKLNISLNLKQNIAKNTIFENLYQCTQGYAHILRQKNICEWYNVKPRNLSEKEIEDITIDYIQKLISDISNYNFNKKSIIKKIITKSNLSLRLKSFFYLKNLGVLK